MRPVVLGPCLVLCLALSVKLRLLPLERIVVASIKDVPTLSDSEITRGAQVQIARSRLTGRQKNHLTWLPAESGFIKTPLLFTRFSHVLVLGDSYADDIDMTFHTWPTQLARKMALPMLNVARGGSVARDARNQLERASAFAGSHNLHLEPSKTLLIVHTSGNDILYALFDPRLVSMLVHDLTCLSLVSRGWIGDLPQLLFPRKLSQHIAGEMEKLLSDAASRGYTNVLISDLPLSPAVPLARLLVHIFAPTADAGFVNKSLATFAGIIRRDLSLAFEDIASKHALKVTIFNEGMILEELANRAHVGNLGVLQTFGLLTRKIMRHIWNFGDDSIVGFWHDGHHPGVAVHHELAKRAIAKASAMNSVLSWPMST